MPSPSTAAKLWSFLNSSVIPDSAVKSVQDSIDSPSLYRNPNDAWWQGLKAGAVGGAANLVTPLNIATTVGGGPALGAIGRLAKAMGAAEEAAPAVEAAVGAARRVRPATPSLVSQVQQQIDALEPEVRQGRGLSNAMADGPWWVSGGINDVVEPLNDELMNLKRLKNTLTKTSEPPAPLPTPQVVTRVAKQRPPTSEEVDQLIQQLEKRMKNLSPGLKPSDIDPFAGSK